MTRFVLRNNAAAADQAPLGTLPGWMGALLRSRGVDTEEKARRFLHPGLEDLHDPFLPIEHNAPGIPTTPELK